MSGRVLVGTSGYSFPDWVGTVYPSGTKPGDFLFHYARWFHAAEINSTFYRIPSPQTFERMATKVPETFTFVVKLPREMTHERGGFERAREPFLAAIRPLADAGKLGGLLAQFPFSFRPGPEPHRYLETLAATFPPDVPLCVEFRNAAWMTDETFAHLQRLSLGFVNVDLPRLPGLPAPAERVTSPTGYVRLHGRNAASWWRHPTPSHRYDYLYVEEELEDWARRIERVAARAGTCYVFANNCHLGQSVVNALQLAERLEIERPTPAGAAELFVPSVGETIRALRAAVLAAKASDLETSSKGGTRHPGAR